MVRGASVVVLMLLHAALAVTPRGFGEADLVAKLREDNVQMRYKDQVIAAENAPEPPVESRSGNTEASTGSQGFRPGRAQRTSLTSGPRGKTYGKVRTAGNLGETSAEPEKCAPDGDWRCAKWKTFCRSGKWTSWMKVLTSLSALQSHRPFCDAGTLRDDLWDGLQRG